MGTSAAHPELWGHGWHLRLVGQRTWRDLGPWWFHETSPLVLGYLQLRNKACVFKPFLGVGFTIAQSWMRWVTGADPFRVHFRQNSPSLDDPNVSQALLLSVTVREYLNNSHFVTFLWAQDSGRYSRSCLEFQKGLCASRCCPQKGDGFAVVSWPRGF